MSEHFIKEIEIKNFKCFVNFKADGFGRVNLIGGKNNIGKTAFMEAIYLYTSKNILAVYKRLLVLKTYRNTYEMLLNNDPDEKNLRALVLENKYIEIGVEKIINKVLTEEEEYHNVSKIYDLTNVLRIKHNEDGLIEFRTKKDTIKVGEGTSCDLDEKSDTYGEFVGWENKEEEKNTTLSKVIDKLNLTFDQTSYISGRKFISSSLSDNKLLENIIGDLKLSESYGYEKLNGYLLKLFDISNIDFIKDKPMVKVKNKYQVLSSFGDGLKSVIFIIGSLLTLKNEYLFIDEIENGIHYNLMDEIWEIILTISKEQNVQVFTTTHSKECIESFHRVQKELEDNDTYYFEMAKNIKTDEVFISQINISQLEYELSHQGKFRGE